MSEMHPIIFRCSCDDALQFCACPHHTPPAAHRALLAHCGAPPAARARAAVKGTSRSDPCLPKRRQPAPSMRPRLVHKPRSPPFLMHRVCLHSPAKHPPAHNARTLCAGIARTLCDDY
eukprot:IDg22534t1